MTPLPYPHLFRGLIGWLFFVAICSWILLKGNKK